MKMLWFLMKMFETYSFLSLFMFCLILLLMILSIKNLHPLMLGLIMLIYSIFISLNLNMFNKSSMYSMMMFLIIIGGFLILFLYFNSFAINNKLIININLINLFFYKFTLIMMFNVILFYKFNMFNLLLFLNNKLLEMMKILESNIYKNNFNINLIYMKFNLLTLFSMIYLLYTLIIVVKILFYTNSKSIRKLM